MIYFLFVTLVN